MVVAAEIDAVDDLERLLAERPDDRSGDGHMRHLPQNIANLDRDRRARHTPSAPKIRRHHHQVGADAKLALFRSVQQSVEQATTIRIMVTSSAIALMVISDRVGRCTRLATTILFIIGIETPKSELQ